MTRIQTERLLRLWQHRLGLERWEIDVAWDQPTAEDAHAQMVRSTTYETATLHLAEDFKSWSDLKMNQILVHELLHCSTRDLDQVHASSEEWLPDHAWRLLDERYGFELEQAIDKLAARLVELAPMP